MRSVLLLNDGVRQWLDREQIEYPVGNSRYPTITELKRCVSAASIKVDIWNEGLGLPWHGHMTTEGAMAYIIVRSYMGDEEEVCFFFQTGDRDLIYLILKLLTPICGPLVLVNSAGNLPEIIHAESSENPP